MLFNNVAKAFLVSGTLSLSVILSGCSGSSSNADPTLTPNTTEASNPPSTSGSYLFYSGSINAVDPAAPASPITLEAGTDIVAHSDNTFLAGTYDLATKTYNNLHAHAIVYAKTDGKLYKASALKSSSTPTPTQLSSEDKVCIIETVAWDIVNPDNSQIVYTTPGPNGTCRNSDDVTNIVRLGMSATDTPVDFPFKDLVTALGDGATGGFSGWLVNDAGALKRCNVNFNCGGSLKTITNYISYEEQSADYTLLNIDGLHYVYDSTASTLSAPIHTLNDNISGANRVISDAGKFYFIPGTARKSIYAVPVDGSTEATLVVTDVDNIIEVNFSTNKLLYSTATAIKTVAKTGGTPTPIVSGAFTTIRLTAVTGNHVYYNFSNGMFPTAGMIDDDGNNKSETTNTQWQALVFGTSWNFSDTIPPVSTLIRTEGYDALGAGKGFAGATVRAFTAANKTEVGVLGTLPADISTIECAAFGANMLCDGLNSTQTDIFFLNAETPGSLVRVTNTPTKNELSN